jgi:hypothetical protein
VSGECNVGPRIDQAIAGQSKSQRVQPVRRPSPPAVSANYQTVAS